MKNLKYLLLALMVMASLMPASSKSTYPTSLPVEGGIVKAAELHYPRIPQPYWSHRLDMVKALGMNTVCLYVFWNVHEPQPGVYDFEGQNDLRAFINLCAEKGLDVILRPGPYVCAEWEMGGLPWWLLRDKDINLRSSDPRFLEAVGRFMERLGREVGDLTADNGGPIKMVQVENEYGSYGVDKEYIAGIRDMVRRNFGDGVTLFQCDWSSNFTDNGLDDLLWTLNFGTWADVDTEFAPLRALRPDQPMMCSEYWSGWFDKWGANHETRPAHDMIAGLDSMLTRGISFSLYMTHGGTNWGHWAGANSPGYAPDVTSYDYDAPIDEQGRPTPKYWLLRDLLRRHAPAGTDTIAVPAPIPTFAFAPVRLDSVAPLFDNNLLQPAGTYFEALPTMEALGQGFGTVLYSVTLTDADPLPSELVVDEAHDYLQVWLDGKYVGSLDRRLGETRLTLPPHEGYVRLDLLVEATGRINFGRAIKDFKGIVGTVTLGGRSIGPWHVSLLPDDLTFYLNANYLPISDTAGATKGSAPYTPGIYRGVINIDTDGDIPDTFLDMSAWGKGLVYVNSHPIGRFWQIGPQQTLYLPGCWLKKGENEVVVLDIAGPREPVVQGLDAPILDRLNLPDFATPSVTTLTPEISTLLQKMTAGSTSGNILALAVTATDDSLPAAIAEIKLLDGQGNTLPREAWRPLYVTSQVTDGNHTLDKAFDLQESTFWRAADTTTQILLIDLGGETSDPELRIIPGPDGAPARYRAALLTR